MKKTRKRVVLLALLVLGVLIAICACAEHRHEYQTTYEWKYDSKNHWKVYHCYCSCGLPGPTPSESEKEPHKPSYPKYDKNSKKDVITCTVCERVLQKQTHQHRHNKKNTTYISVTDLNASQHKLKYKDSKLCECGDEANISYRYVTENHRFTKISESTKANGDKIITYRCMCKRTKTETIKKKK